MRLIDADALETRTHWECFENFDDDYEYVLKADIDHAPTIAERRGKWEFIGGYGYQYRCTACILCAEHKTHYCPNCGAKMEEEES